MTIKLRNKRRGVLRININLWVPSKQTYFTALAIFDTGAYKTIIDEALADVLQLPLEQNTSPTVTAAGMVSTAGSTLPVMILGTRRLKDIPVNVMKLPDELETRCILGMNILQEFDISISNYDGVVTLTPKPLPKKFFVENYSITLTSVEDKESEEITE
jgi:predicted aspartyl protease